MIIMKQHCILVTVLLFTLFMSGQNPFERKIQDTFLQSKELKEDNLANLIQELKSGKEKNKAYWISYALYKQATLHGRTNEEKALSILNEATQLLESKKEKDSEDYALLGFITSYSIIFQTEIAAIISSKASGYYNKSLTLDKNNFRPYLGLGKSDYFRPIKYGGGLKAESYLKKAMVLINSKEDKKNSPRWGEGSVYYYLISFYEKTDKINEATLYYNIGIKKFPESESLKSLATKLGL